MELQLHQHVKVMTFVILGWVPLQNLGSWLSQEGFPLPQNLTFGPLTLGWCEIILTSIDLLSK